MNMMDECVDHSKIEDHPLQPFLPTNAKMLMLGSFPPKQIRWKMDFYYPNFQNDMWRIFGLVFFNDREHFLLTDLKSFDKNKIVEFLQDKGIALYDTATRIVRLKDNASDKFLHVVDVINLSEILEKLPDCETIVTTGQKATDILTSLIEVVEPRVGESSDFVFRGRKMRFYRMPSTSRAYPKAITEKADIYRRMFMDSEVLKIERQL